VAAAVRGRSGARPWWALLIAGLVGIGAGLVGFFMPGLTALAPASVIAFWALASGVFEIIAAVRLRKVITNEWWLGLSGALAVVFGVVLMLAPGPGALAMVFWIGGRRRRVWGVPRLSLFSPARPPPRRRDGMTTTMPAKTVRRTGRLSALATATARRCPTPP
jgi:short repeat uncharacterized protein DUF308